MKEKSSLILWFGLCPTIETDREHASKALNPLLMVPERTTSLSIARGVPLQLPYALVDEMHP